MQDTNPFFFEACQAQPAKVCAQPVVSECNLLNSQEICEDPSLLPAQDS